MKYSVSLPKIAKMRNKVMTPERSDDRRLAFAAFFPTTLLSVQLLLLYGFGLLQYHSTIRLIMIVLSALALLRALPVIVKRRLLLAIFLYLAVLIVTVSSMLLIPLTIPGISSVSFDLFMRCLPSFLCIATLQKKDIILSELKRQSVVILITSVLYTYFTLFGSRFIELSYSMSFSYYLLLPACAYLVSFYQNGKAMPLLLSIASLLMMFLLGSRGAVISYLVLFALLLLQDRKSKPLRTIVLVLFTILLIVFLGQILEGLTAFLMRIGYRSRSLSLLSGGSFVTHLSGREVLYEEAIQAIWQSPYWGYGLAGDRAQLGINYPHNIFLELMLHFGIPIGGLLSVGLLSLFILAYLREKDKKLISMMIAMGFVPMLVSGTYLTSATFWIALGCSIFSVGNHERKIYFANSINR